MRYNHLIVFFFTGIQFLFSGCGIVKYAKIVNNADYSVVVYGPDYRDEYNYVYDIKYPDTTLYTMKERSKTTMIEVPPRTKYSICACVNEVNPLDMEGCFGQMYESLGVDTISWYIFDADSINRYGLNKQNYQRSLIQRYDMSLYDFARLQKTGVFTFPPTAKMKDIKMWPPYGTYDEKGNTIK